MTGTSHFRGGLTNFSLISIMITYPGLISPSFERMRYITMNTRAYLTLTTLCNTYFYVFNSQTQY